MRISLIIRGVHRLAAGSTTPSRHLRAAMAASPLTSPLNYGFGVGVGCAGGRCSAGFGCCGRSATAGFVTGEAGAASPLVIWRRSWRQLFLYRLAREHLVTLRRHVNK